MLNIDDDANFETVRSIDGELVRILRPGGRLRVPLEMRDAALREDRTTRRKTTYDPQSRLSETSVEEEDIHDSARRGVGFLHDGHGNAVPGYLVRADIANVQRRRAYQDYDVWIQNRFRDQPPTGFGSHGLRGPQVGDPCTCRGAEYPD